MRRVNLANIFELGESLGKLQMMVDSMAAAEEAKRTLTGIIEYESWSQPPPAAPSSSTDSPTKGD